MKFWVPWGIAAVVTGVAVCFFLIGLADGSVSSFNAGLWMLILLGTVGVTARGSRMAAKPVARMKKLKDNGASSIAEKAPGGTSEKDTRADPDQPSLFDD